MREHEIAGTVLNIRDYRERVAFLDQACAGDPQLRSRVEALLESQAADDGVPRDLAERETSVFTGPDAPYGPTVADEGNAQPTVDLSMLSDSKKDESLATSRSDGAGAFKTDVAESSQTSELMTDDLHRNPTETTYPSTELSSRSVRPGTGSIIGGRYELQEILGEGGMGIVYRAQQTQPVKRSVALKLIKSGMDSRTVVARFDAERQALAMMDHPNIARVYDGGVSEANQLFFVMELVNGEPITAFCDRNGLSVRARIELFVNVCLAVQHAHQKGIIHRDLKPGNVLVTLVDGRPTPKVIDFGVAKATEVRLTEMSFSDTGAIVGTPTYMSPEQADPSSMGIDTRTDVYALGVILYELLVGSPPLDAKDFKRGAVLEMLRMVREVEPPRPSTRLKNSRNQPSIAANRGLLTAALANALERELDWVVMKALEKDRNRRYDTANGMARDLQRYLADEVVEARPPGGGYRLKKFIRRNKGQVIAVSLVMFTLIAGVIGTTIGLLEARRQTAYAKQGWGKADQNFATARALILNMGNQINQIETGQKNPKLADLARKQALDSARTEFDRFRVAQPDDETLQTQAAALHRYAANVSRILGDYPASTSAYAESIRISEDLAARFPEQSQHHFTLALTLGDRALLEMLIGKLNDSANTLDRARSIAERREGTVFESDYWRTVGWIEHDSAKIAYLLGRFEESARFAGRSGEFLERLKVVPFAQRQAVDPLLAVMAVNDLAKARRELGRHAEAMVLHDDALARMKRFDTTKGSRDELFWLCEVNHQRAMTSAEIIERRDIATNDLVELGRIAEKLVDDYPQVVHYREKLAAIYLQRGELLTLLGQLEPATAELTKSLAVSRVLLDRFGVLSASMLVRGQTFLALGRVRSMAGKTEEGQAHWKNAAKVFEIAIKIDPDNFHHHRGLEAAKRALNPSPK